MVEAYLLAGPARRLACGRAAALVKGLAHGVDSRPLAARGGHASGPPAVAALERAGARRLGRGRRAAARGLGDRAGERAVGVQAALLALVGDDERGAAEVGEREH